MRTWPNGDASIPLQRCPKCHEEMDAAFDSDHPGAAPKSGTFCVCSYCAQLLRFNRNLLLEIVTPEAFAALPLRLRSMIRLGQQAAERAKRARDGRN